MLLRESIMQMLPFPVGVGEDGRAMRIADGPIVARSGSWFCRGRVIAAASECPAEWCP